MSDLIWSMPSEMELDHGDEGNGSGSSRRKPKRRKEAKESPMLGESDDPKRVSRIGNHIYFRAGVTKESIGALNEHIVKLNREFEEVQREHTHVVMEPPPIILHINSYGGSVFAGFWAVDIIKQSKLPVDTVVEGAVASCGTIMSVVGRKRYIRPTGSMLIHQLSGWFGGKMTEIDDEYQNLEQMMKTIKNIYRVHTTMTGTQLDELLKHDVWWMSEKCIALGLVDDVWQGD